jgi:selenocysteine-specific elongation factor
VTAPPLTLGTAGHIDHGKTALVAALTGVDTDRLPEEKARGISIALGYAPLTLPSGRRLSVVDVPGHERFVRTMVAGATGIDLYLMVVAADDGVMPQTREHATVLAALGVAVGVVAVTKADLADPARALAEARALLPGAQAVAVSVKTGEGLAPLQDSLQRAADRVPGRAGALGATRLHVDRAFTVKGAGTVVTGTLWSGSVARGDQVTVLPHGRRARVRAVEVHDAPAERAQAGQRVALNLAGVERAEVARGDVVVAGDAAPTPSYRLDVALQWAAPDARPDGGARIAVHHGTRETAARLTELGGRFFQLRLEQPLVAAGGDRVVIRSLAPPDTLGGGVVLDAAPSRHGPSRDLLARLARIERGEPEPESVPEPASAKAPLTPLTPAALALEERLRAAGHEPPLDAELDPEALALLVAHGRAIRVGRDMHAHPDALAAVRERVRTLAERDGEITLAGLRDELQTSRKFAQALLEHCDAERLTLRVGDARRLRRR